MGPVYSFDPWHIFRSMLPFTPTPSPLFKLYHHLLDPVRIFSISGEFAGHLIPLSKDSLNARKVMQAKLSNRRKVVDHRGLEIIDYKAEFLDPDIRKSIVSSAAISKDGHFIALGFGNGDIEVVDIDQQHAITRFQCNSRNPLAWIEFISGGHRIAVEDNEGNIFIFDNGMQPLKLGTLPSGCYPPVTEVADNGSFIVRLPRHLGSYWYDGVAILYLSGEPSICIFSTPGFIPVPARLPTIPCGLTLELSPGARYVVACDRKHAFIWSTESRKFIAHYDLPNFEAFVTGATTFRPYIATGTQHSEGSIPHIQGSGVECDLDKSWLESLSHKRLYHFYSPAMGGAAKPKLYLNNTLKLILPIEYHPVPNRPEGWYGDRVIWVEDFIYFPRASEDGTRLLVQGGMKAPIVVDIGQIA
ncbi:uncharacterized protein EI90DRAFT_2203210 [Cantharellus anzutake]|uniref:uncharacterized protein n=1 Tax=Cantharellus anzutake TaxID=1750568 RepID=UPI001908B7ED|nr:uncharacterized protein EI90DRAFT_2203210 [Cantharellus anzutake]KAF8324971.1 hypothetical protein EI90DRAFT_2203210 [Cantharellus anzutake]